MLTSRQHHTVPRPSPAPSSDRPLLRLLRPTTSSSTRGRRLDTSTRRLARRQSSLGHPSKLTSSATFAVTQAGHPPSASTSPCLPPCLTTFRPRSATPYRGTQARQCRRTPQATTTWAYERVLSLDLFHLAKGVEQVRPLVLPASGQSSVGGSGCRSTQTNGSGPPCPCLCSCRPFLDGEGNIMFALCRSMRAVVPFNRSTCSYTNRSPSFRSAGLPPRYNPPGQQFATQLPFVPPLACHPDFRSHAHLRPRLFMLRNPCRPTERSKQFCFFSCFSACSLPVHLSQRLSPSRPSAPMSTSSVSLTSATCATIASAPPQQLMFTIGVGTSPTAPSCDAITASTSAQPFALAGLLRR